MGRAFLSGGEEFNKYSIKEQIDREINAHTAGSPYLEIDWNLAFPRNDNKFQVALFHRGATFRVYDKDGNAVSVSEFSLVALWATPLHSLNNQSNYWFDPIHTAYTNTIVLGASMVQGQFIIPANPGDPHCFSIFIPSSTELELWFCQHPGYFPVYGNAAIDELRAVFSFLITYDSYKFVPILPTNQKYYDRVILFGVDA